MNMRIQILLKLDGGCMEKNDELESINTEELKNLIYTIRGQKVMLDADLAKIYGYETKNFNRQVKNNIEKFDDDFMFKLTDDEVEYLRCNFCTANISAKSRYNPSVFTEQGIYMLMTILNGELAVKQSKTLIRIFKSMKDYLSDNKSLITSADYCKLATITSQNIVDIGMIKEKMVTKSDLQKFIKTFNDNRVAKDYVIYNGQTVEANLAYSEIYSKAKKTIYVVDNYIGLKTLTLLRSVKEGVTVIIFSDNIGNGLRLTDYNEYVSEYGHPQMLFKRTDGKFHDRYIIIDHNTRYEKIYHCGASSKDAGKRMTSISLAKDNMNYRDMVNMLLMNPILKLR